MNQQAVTTAIETLEKQHGEQQVQRINKGVKQVALVWQESDGSPSDFINFCTTYFESEKNKLDAIFARIEKNLESIYGHNHEVIRDLSSAIQLDIGPLLNIDYLFAQYNPSAHVKDDLFNTKIAFVILLNFPVYSLEECLSEGYSWSREQWAQTRAAQKFTERVPAHIQQNLSNAYVAADDYISNYNIYMHNILNNNNQRLFPGGLKLISHWGLRDELKAQYGQENSLPRQQMIQLIMERIIRQEIPHKAVNNDSFDWNPAANTLVHNNKSIDFISEKNCRYQQLLNIFQAEYKADQYYPQNPNKIDRRFNKDREILEKDFKTIIGSALTDPVLKNVALLISKRIGRPLQPFDIWYNGFKSKSTMNEAELDKIVSQKYPTVEYFENNLATILATLGFDKTTADFLSSKIEVDPSRGAGHAMGAERREDNAHLRTRIPDQGMKYKGFNIAIHELGHNVEQVFSLNKIDYYSLQGVPNTAFTEAFAFVFQSRDMDVLGLVKEDKNAEYLKALDTYWSTCEIGAVGLVDIEVWHWMYDHPEASAEELKQAVINISKEIWNNIYAPIFGVKDQIILGIYSHMIDAGLYLPDYSLGHIISFQIEQYLHDKNLGQEMERMCRLGTLTPEAWMKAAVGGSISTQPLIDATKKAVLHFNK